MFIFSFKSPPKVAVKEEYLIYDAVAMVGAVGGTLGLCIGFSFSQLSTCLLGLIEMALKWTQITSGSIEETSSKMEDTDAVSENIMKAIYDSESRQAKRLRMMENRLSVLERFREASGNPSLCDPDI